MYSYCFSYISSSSSSVRKLILYGLEIVSTSGRHERHAAAINAASACASLSLRRRDDRGSRKTAAPNEGARAAAIEGIERCALNDRGGHCCPLRCRRCARAARRVRTTSRVIRASPAIRERRHGGHRKQHGATCLFVRINFSRNKRERATVHSDVRCALVHYVSLNELGTVETELPLKETAPACVIEVCLRRLV